MSACPPGWYLDRRIPGHRYWDGEVWETQTAEERYG